MTIRCVPFEKYTSEGGNPIIIFNYDAVFWCALETLGLWDKALRYGVEIMFTLDYAQYYKTLGDVLAGVKIVDRSAIKSKNDYFLIAD